MNKDIALNKRIIFALDLPRPDLAKDWVTRLLPEVKFFKVGLELFLAGGFAITDWIIAQGAEVMLDLKFFDVPQTVLSALRQLKGKKISLTTIHGNDAILKQAAKAEIETKILAVTVLTSLDQGDLSDLGFDCQVKDLVLSRAKRALKAGCAGVVASGLEARAIRQHLGNSLLIIVPGVRPVINQSVDDQKRIITPALAIKNGADHVVIGRPIRQASNPLEQVKKIKNELIEVL